MKQKPIAFFALIAFITLSSASLIELKADLRGAEDWKAKGLDFWQQKLTKQQVTVCRQKGTEQAFSGAFYKSKETGIYVCASCALPLFDSNAKFDSGTGWPSFTAAIKDAVTLQEDKSWFSTRTEVVCSRCGAHLGHVFDDGPRPTGKRYCMNSICLDFVKASSK